MASIGGSGGVARERDAARAGSLACGTGPSGGTRALVRGANGRNGAPTGGVKRGRKGSVRPCAARVGATLCSCQVGPRDQGWRRARLRWLSAAMLD